MRSLFSASRQLFTNTAPPYVVPSTRLTLPTSWGGAGPKAQMRAMGASETLYAIVNRTSTAVSALDWGLWKPSPDGDPDTRKQVLKHAVLDFLAKPNPFMTWGEFIEISQQHMDLVGEMWWVLSYGSAGRMRMPVEMWPVRPDRMEPVPSKLDFIAGYVYTGPSGERIPLTVEEVVFSKMPNPEDIYRGMGPVQTILNRIDAQRFSAEWNANFFKNNAAPGGIIQAPDQVTDEEFNTFRERWEEQHKGTAAAGRVALIEGGWTWVDRKFSHADMQFTELESAGVEAIMRAYTISKFDLGMVDDVNRATAEASKAVFGERITVPRANRIKRAVQTGILPKFGADALIFDYDRTQAVPADRESDDRERLSRSQAFKTYIDAGVDPAEAAEVCGLPPLKVTKPAAPVPPPAVPGGGAEQATTALLAGMLQLQALRETHDHRPRRERPRAAADPFAGAGVPAETVAVAEDALVAQEQAVEALMVVWAAEVTPAQLDEIEAQVEEAVSLGDLAALGALVVGTAAAGSALLAAMVALATAAATALATAGGLTSVPSIPHGELEPEAAATAELLGRGLAVEAGAEALRRAGAGASAREVARGVRGYLEGLAGRTLRERLSAALWYAQTLGRYKVMQVGELLGLIEAYVAVEVNDRNRCPACDEIDGTIYDNLSEARQDYPVIGYIDCAGGIRCRGAALPVWS